MSITDIKNKIISETEDQKDLIEKDFEQKVSEIKKGFLAEKKKLEDVFEADLKKSLEENKRKFLSVLNREEKVKTENLKREFIDGVFKESLSSIEKISGQEFENFASKALSAVPKNVEGKVMVNSENLDSLKKVLNDHSSLLIEKDDSISGGFLIVGDNFSYDFTFENLLRLKKSDIELGLSNILF